MIRDIFFMSLDALRSHKIRTFLTLVGVIIGIGSVIIVTTAGTSVKSFIEEQWNIFNPTGMVIGIGTATDPPQISFNKVAFTDHDIAEMKKLPHVKDVAPVGLLPLKAVKLKEGFLKWQSKPGGTMYATTSALLDILGLKIDQGRIFQEGKKEVVISKSISQIFGKDKPLQVGDTIYIQRIDGKTIKTTVVGIFKESESTSLLSQVTALSIAGPVNPYYSSYFGSNIGGILKRITGYGILSATADDKEHVTDAKNEILAYLNSSKSDAIKYKDKNSDFVVVTQQYILSKVDQIMSVMSMLITAIAMISLVVGGIGIANIMFATVTERTREIGTMMAIGAKRGDILRLFLFQSSMIGLMGGIFGCIIGASGGAFIIEVLNRYLREIGTFSSGRITLIYSSEWFIIAVIFGIAIGIVAGVLPARKAAKMDPVIALRYE